MEYMLKCFLWNGKMIWKKILKDSIEKKVGASEIPDMFSAYNDIAYTIDQMHGIVDLNKYFSDDELDEYIEGYVQDGNILNNGKLKFSYCKIQQKF